MTPVVGREHGSLPNSRVCSFGIARERLITISSSTVEEHPKSQENSISRFTICVNGRREEYFGFHEHVMERSNLESVFWTDEESATPSNIPRKSPIRLDRGQKATDSNFPNVAPWNSRGQSSSLSHLIVSSIRSGSNAGGNEASLSVTTDRIRRLGSFEITSLASSVNGELM